MTCACFRFPAQRLDPAEGELRLVHPTSQDASTGSAVEAGAKGEGNA